LADSVRSAQSRAYDAAGKIQFEGKQWRSDIGFRALKR
jgi:phosphoribosylamine--glycine ligase